MHAAPVPPASELGTASSASTADLGASARQHAPLTARSSLGAPSTSQKALATAKSGTAPSQAKVRPALLSCVLLLVVR